MTTRPSLLSVSTGVALMCAMAWSATANAATIGRKILDDGLTVMLSSPDAARDSTGNIHIVAQGTATSDTNQADRQIYYMLVKPDGTVLVAPTVVNTGAISRKGRPRVAITSDNKAVIVVAGGNGQSLPVYYIEIDPSLDTTLDGGPLAPAAIVKAQTNVGVSTGTSEISIAIDSNDVVHVLKPESTNLLHMSFNPTSGAVVTAEHTIGTEGRQTQQGFAIDSNDNLHVAYEAEDVDSNAPAAYKMLSNTGTILIDSTPLFEGTVFPHAAHISLMLDSSDKVYITYGDKRNTLDASNWCDVCESAGSSFFVKLDPSKAPQDGTASDMATLRVGDEKYLGDLWYGRAFRVNGTVHFFASGHHGRGNIYHRTVSTSGMSGLRAIEANIGGVNYSKHYVTVAGSKVIFSEDVFAPTPNGGVTQLVMSSVGAYGGGGGGSSSGAMPVFSLAVLGLAALARRGRFNAG